MLSTALIYSNTNHGLKKKTLYRKKFEIIFFIVDYVKTIELHIVNT